MKPEYPVSTSEQNNEILYTSQVRKGVYLEIRFRFSEDRATGITTLTETIDVKANQVVAMVLLNTMKKAHLGLLEQLKTIVNKG